MKTADKLIANGWTELSKDGMMVKAGDDGGIIDSRIVDGKWFVIFGDAREAIEELDSRESAAAAFIEASKTAPAERAR